jgi:hypothetical protein
VTDCDLPAGYADHQTSVAKVPWPTLGEVQSWISASGYATASGWHGTAVELLQFSLDAAVAKISERCGLTGLSTELVKPNIKLAAIMQSFKWYDRHRSPTGALGSAEFGKVVRTAPIDEDVEALLSNDILFGLA